MNMLMKKFLTGCLILIAAVVVMTGCSNSKDKLPSDNNAQNSQQNTVNSTLQQGTKPAATDNAVNNDNQKTSTQPYKYDTSAPQDINKIKLDNFNKINDGMKYEEVINIMGAPTQMKDTKASNGAEIKFCTWKSKEGKEYVVTFNNGLVSGKMADK